MPGRLYYGSRALTTSHSKRYFETVAALAQAVDGDKIDALARGIAAVRKRSGRLFVLGVGAARVTPHMR